MPKKLTQEDFENKAKLVHNGLYKNYGEYYGSKKSIDILCPIHGWFKQIADYHLQGKGCSKCGRHKIGNSKKYSFDVFCSKANHIHNHKYKYTSYVNSVTPITIICPTHGEFQQIPRNHLQGQGCTKCKNKILSHSRLSNTGTFIQKAKDVHKRNKYLDYSLVTYGHSKAPVKIICNKTDKFGVKHGVFEIRPNDHLSGHGCNKCGREIKSKLEEEVNEYLTKQKIKFTTLYKPKWLGRQHLDFYLPDYNVAIECQGIQHFKPSRLFGESEFVKTCERDYKKKIKCQENGIDLLYYSNLGINYPYEVFEDMYELLQRIKRHNYVNITSK